MIRVSPRAHRHEDRSGDPLDGLVNLFDLGIVLSVGFLLAALSALNLAGRLTDGTTSRDRDQISVPSDAATGSVPPEGTTVIGQGTQVGQVYRLDDGRLVYVVPSGSPSAAGSASPASPAAAPSTVPTAGSSASPPTGTTSP